MKTFRIFTSVLLFSSLLFGCIEERDNEVFPVDTPHVDFSFGPQETEVGDEIFFTAEPQPGSTEISTWNWRFGEGSTSNEQNPSFTYDRAGSYDVTLMATDVFGTITNVSKEITIASGEVLFPASIIWEFTTGTEVFRANDGSSSPAIGDDGTIYYLESRAGDNSQVVAVTDNGESADLKWATISGGVLPNAPSIGPDGNIYINSWDASVGISKLDASSGEVIWSNSTGAGVSNSTAAIDSQGNIYHGSRAGAQAGIFSWTPDGDKRWEIVDEGNFYAAPAISADESTVYYLNTDNGEIWAINTEDGSEKWSSPVGTGSGPHGTSLSIDADGTIYFTTGTHVVAVTDEGETGTVKWQTELDDPANSGVVIGPEGNLYTGSMEGLVSLDPSDGSINWVYEAEIQESVPAVDVNGNVYVGTTNGWMIVVNSEGELEAEFQLGDGVVQSPTITEDGTVYVEANANSNIKLYKIAVEESGPANSAWPMKGQNVKNTGKAQ